MAIVKLLEKYSYIGILIAISEDSLMCIKITTLCCILFVNFSTKSLTRTRDF